MRDWQAELQTTPWTPRPVKTCPAAGDCEAKLCAQGVSPSSDESNSLLQANGRGYWETSEENLERLRQLYTDVEVRFKPLLSDIQDNCHAWLLPAYVVHMGSVRFRWHAAAAAAARVSPHAATPWRGCSLAVETNCCALHADFAGYWCLVADVVECYGAQDKIEGV